MTGRDENKFILKGRSRLDGVCRGTHTGAVKAFCGVVPYGSRDTVTSQVIFIHVQNILVGPMIANLLISTPDNRLHRTSLQDARAYATHGFPFYFDVFLRSLRPRSNIAPLLLCGSCVAMISFLLNLLTYNDRHGSPP